VWVGFASEYERVVNSGERGNGPSGSTEGGEFLDYSSDISSQVILCSMELVAVTVSRCVLYEFSFLNVHLFQI
jgi:hypothetical protein